MPKIVTRQTRVAESHDNGELLARALRTAKHVETNGTDAEREAAWADVANYAGQIQRRTRQLAGLGRGG